jgi:hypothetical protein
MGSDPFFRYTPPPMHILRPSMPNSENTELDRRSFVHTGVAASISLITGSIGSFCESISTKHSNGRHPALDSAPESLTVTEILYEELGHMKIVEKRATQPEPEQNSDLSFFQTLQSVLVQAHEKVDRNIRSDDPTDEKVENIMREVDDWAEWADSFHLSKEQTINGHEPIDCNDPVYQIPEKLSTRGIPMYIVSIWPKDPELRGIKDWHQIAACKGDDKYFLIYSKGSPLTIWNGSLAQYVNECDRFDIPREIIPVFGISKFVEPKYDTAPAKWWQQISNAVPEDEMEVSRLRLHHTQEPIYYV